jgi:LysR family transcriptional regulator, cell division regulator
VDLQQLITFATVARTGTITHAATELHTVQSNVTARIRLLEADVGAPLFHRHARGVTMTNASERLLPYAVQIAQLARDARRALSSDGEPSGPLRIGSLESTAGYRLPPVLIAYGTAYPDVDVTLVTGTTRESIAAVLERRVEGALVAGPLAHPDLEVGPLLAEELVLVSSPAWPGLTSLTNGTTVTALVLRSGCSYRARLEALLGARGVTTARTQELGTIDGIVGCAAAGLGVSLLPRVVVQQAYQRGTVALHTMPREVAIVETLFIRRRDAFVSPALARFVEYCRAHFSLPISRDDCHHCF